MKKTLIKLGLVTAISTSLLGFTYEIKDGWQQLGAIEDIEDMTIFNNAGCVDHVWYYDNNDTNNPEWRLHIADGNTYNYCGETLDSLKKGQGFWVKATGNCTIEIDEPSCNPLGMPTVPGFGNCDANVTNPDNNITSSIQKTCKDVLDNEESKGDGLYLLDSAGTPFTTYCDMTADGGGWTAFFSGTNGSTNVFAQFETGDSFENNDEYLKRIPSNTSIDTTFAASCGDAMVKFNVNSQIIDFFTNGTQSSWQSISNSTAIGSENVSVVPTYLWTGDGANNGWMLSSDSLTLDKTFSSNYNYNNAWDFCNSKADTTSNIKLYYK